MACPDSITIRNLNGRFTLNTAQSGAVDDLLGAQGLAWLKRKAIKISPVTLNIKMYADADASVHVDVHQSVLVNTTEERRHLTWAWAEKNDDAFGRVRGRARFCALGELPEEYMRTGFDAGSLERDGDEVIEAYAESLDKAWSADQAWGFAIVGNERKYVRHIYFRHDRNKEKEGKVLQVRTVYDYVGPVP